MDDTRIQAALERTDKHLRALTDGLNDSTSGIRKLIRGSSAPLLEEISVNISRSETQLTRVIALIAQTCEYRILSAYYHASPGLIAFITGLYTAVMVIVNIFATLNKIILTITGETLAYWVDKLFPGFQDAWLGIMKQVSEFSAALGWGVDGVQHLMNAGHAGADLWGTVFNKDLTTVKIEKFARTETLLNSYSHALSSWQQNPGANIALWAEGASGSRFFENRQKLTDTFDRLSSFGAKAEKALTDVGTVTSEVLALRNDMPAFIAKNIPSGIWDGILKVDTTINERILPALTDITDRIEELDKVLEVYRKKAEELASRLSHPGDLLTEIDKLPEYARKDQLSKIDSITSATLRESNEAEFEAVAPDLRAFSLVAAALSQPPPPLGFMDLELPGRSPGITEEPRETWQVGDY